MMSQPNYAPGMRDAASQIRARMNRVATVVNRLDAQLASMTYAGPAADQFRARMQEHRSGLLKVSGLMSQLADVLIREAQAIEAQGGGILP